MKLSVEQCIKINVTDTTEQFKRHFRHHKHSMYALAEIHLGVI